MRQVRRPSAIARAQQRWGEVALDGRRQLRAAGVRGDLRPLDEIASGSRGGSVPRGIAQLALDLRAAGMPAEQVAALLTDALTQIVADVANGPSAA
jgi:hypothetical protein